MKWCYGHTFQRTLVRCTQLGLDTENEWQVAHAVVEIKGNKLPKRINNPHPYPIKIPQRQPLAKVCQISPEQIDTNEIVLQVQSDGEMEVTVRAIQETAEDCTSGGVPHCADLPTSQKERVEQLLAKWRCVFSQDEKYFGRTDAVLH